MFTLILTAGAFCFWSSDQLQDQSLYIKSGTHGLEAELRWCHVEFTNNDRYECTEPFHTRLFESVSEAHSPDAVEFHGDSGLRVLVNPKKSDGYGDFESQLWIPDFANGVSGWCKL